MTDKKKSDPTGYTLKLAEEICLAISVSIESVSKLCKQNPNWPCITTIQKWRILKKDFGEMYQKAKSAQIESLVDKAIDLASDSSKDFLENYNGMPVPMTVAINRHKLEIETIKWMAAKLAPRVYGDKVQQEITVKTHEESIKDLK